MTFSQYTLDTIPGVPPHYQIYQRKESYRYDALGRRVWVELVRDTNCTTHDTGSDCSNYVRRVNWDGNQILHETQVAADTGSWNLTLEGGSVTYVHGGTIDQPLEVYKASNNIVVPYVNWRGQFVAGTCPLGACSGVQFPLSDASAYDDIPGGVGQGTWFGTLIKGQIDASGYEYKRNRYYNPSTGRFNQEDPIGLAGGLNVYGYASGDPTSYSDPFGLSQCTRDNVDDCTFKDVWHNFVAGLGAVGAGDFVDKGPGWGMGFALSQIMMMGATSSPIGGTTAAVSTAASGLGDLTNGEVKAIQAVVEKAGRPLDVVGSAARGLRGAGSDVDYTTAGANLDHFRGLDRDLPGISQHSILRGSANPFEGPSIRFEPGVAPQAIPQIN